MDKLSKMIVGGAIGAAVVGTTLLLNKKRKEVWKIDFPAALNVDLSRYMGRWYEIARIDYRFEKNLQNVYAEYTLLNDGTVRVMNRGYNIAKSEWRDVEGIAKPAGARGEGKLKVSFFRPFWSNYTILDITDDYKHALVAGDNVDYLWLLSREKEIPEDIQERFLERATDLGFDTNQLYWVIHTSDV